MLAKKKPFWAEKFVAMRSGFNSTCCGCAREKFAKNAHRSSVNRYSSSKVPTHFLKRGCSKQCDPRGGAVFHSFLNTDGPPPPPLPARCCERTPPRGCERTPPEEQYISREFVHTGYIHSTPIPKFKLHVPYHSLQKQGSFESEVVPLHAASCAISYPHHAVLLVEKRNVACRGTNNMATVIRSLPH